MRKVFILTICIVSGINIFGQAGVLLGKATVREPKLKNGVYEFSVSDDNVKVDDWGGSGGIIIDLTERSETHRSLMVKNDSVIYKTHSSTGISGMTGGVYGNCLLKLTGGADSKYKAKNKNIHLIIKVADNDTIIVGVIRGSATKYYSGGRYVESPTDLPPESQALTFVRELTEEDEKLFSPVLTNTPRF